MICGERLPGLADVVSAMLPGFVAYVVALAVMVAWTVLVVMDTLILMHGHYHGL